MQECVVVDCICKIVWSKYVFEQFMLGLVICASSLILWDNDSALIIVLSVMQVSA